MLKVQFEKNRKEELHRADAICLWGFYKTNPTLILGLRQEILQIF